jgi:hypothetical protein
MERSQLPGDPDRCCSILSGNGRRRLTNASVQRAPYVVVERCDGGDARVLRVHAATITATEKIDAKNLLSLTGQ